MAILALALYPPLLIGLS